uniref:Transcription factor ILI6 isoform X1 n=1 Tax=Cymbidium ensifolium TaxID=78740 RepID=A0A515HG21_CYMEN|nr:transcription factor ILI6 isoform X1 [Cymbidium ensifolium]
MSRRSSRSRQRSFTSSRITENQINDLISILQNLVPEAQIYATGNRDSAAGDLQEVCNYIRSLHEEIDYLSQRNSELLPTADSSILAGIFRSLLM